MEPFDGSSKYLGENLKLLFQQHRGKSVAGIDTPEATDSGYSSLYLTTSNNTPNLSSLSSSNLATITSTPQRLSNTSNLNTIDENFERIETTKLTPVTQNIRNINNFHITTPKDDQNAPRKKRSSVVILNFEDFESTPKKSKIDEVFCLQTKEEAHSASSTPRKITRFRTKKQAFRQRLKSAPDLDTYFNVNNIENEQSPRRTNLSPINCKSTSRGSRTPLSSSSSNLMLFSTPKSSNYNFGIYDAKPSSVKKLLQFSDSQFEQLISSGRSDISSDIKDPADFQKSSSRNFEETNDLLKPLSSSDFCTDISSEQASRNYKKIYPVISTVLRDREVSSRELSSSRILRQVKFSENLIGVTKSSSLSITITATTSSATNSSATTKLNKDKTETESQGFQDILNINNDCHDMEISAICECSKSPIGKDSFQDGPSTINDCHAMEISATSECNKSSNEADKFQDDCHELEISATCECAKSPIENNKTTTNYSIKSNVDLELNSTIVCETKSPKSNKTIAVTLPSTTLSSEDGKSIIPLPQTPKKMKRTSFNLERLEILYPTIRRTPSKYNPLMRAPHKRKSESDLSNTYKRHCKFYGGNTHLNIIGKLETYGHLLERIFRNLSNQDLANMCEVSKSWRRAIYSNRTATQQVRRYMRSCTSSKENDGEGQLEDAAIKEKSREEAVQRLPFNQSNLRIDRKRTMIDANRSPPVSPSKRKFHENQKVVKTLAPNEKLIKCPRCNKSSRIYNALSLEMNNRNNNNATTTNKFITQLRSTSETFTTGISTPASRYVSTPTTSSFSAPSGLPFCTRTASTFHKLRFTKALSLDSSLMSESSEASQFGECSGLTCKYRFCLDCLCEYHPGAKCQLYEPNSPTKDDLQNGILQLASSTRSIKNTRRKSLKRLCF